MEIVIALVVAACLRSSSFVKSTNHAKGKHLTASPPSGHHVEHIMARIENNGKIKNAETLAKRFGVFVSVGDTAIDLENAKAALAYRIEKQDQEKRPALVTVADYVQAHPECATFETSKKGKEVCRISTEYKGQTYKWCGLIKDMRTTRPFWLQED